MLLSLMVSVVCGQEKNPFDLEERDTLIEKTSLEVQEVEAIPDSSKIQMKEDTASAIPQVNSNNPFSISHVPIRKTRDEQKVTTAIKDNIQKETISISYLPLWIVILSLCVLAVIIVIKATHLIELVKSIFNNNLMRLTAYEENGGLTLSYILGYLLFLVNFSLLLYLGADKIFGIRIEAGYFFILVAVLVFFVGKHIILFFTSLLFEFEKEAQIYSFTINSFYNIQGLFLLCLNILLVFGPDNWGRGLAFAGVFIFIIFLLSRYYKGLGIARKYINGYFFHFFLYFCAFEFSPWLIIYSLFRELI